MEMLKSLSHSYILNKVINKQLLHTTIIYFTWKDESAEGAHEVARWKTKQYEKFNNNC